MKFGGGNFATLGAESSVLAIGAGGASIFGLLPVEQPKAKQQDTTSSSSAILEPCEPGSARIGSLLMLALNVRHLLVL